MGVQLPERKMMLRHVAASRSIRGWAGTSSSERLRSGKPFWRKVCQPSGGKKYRGPSGIREHTAFACLRLVRGPRQRGNNKSAGWKFPEMGPAPLVVKARREWSDDELALSPRECTHTTRRVADMAIGFYNNLSPVSTHDSQPLMHCFVNIV